jgi:hypothetical protein
MRFSYDHFRCRVPKAAGGGVQVIVIGIQVPCPAKPRQSKGSAVFISFSFRLSCKRRDEAIWNRTGRDGEEQEHSHSEIGNDDRTVRVSRPIQDVLRFEISVDDVVFVQVLDGREDLAAWDVLYNDSRRQCGFKSEVTSDSRQYKTSKRRGTIAKEDLD